MAKLKAARFLDLVSICDKKSPVKIGHNTTAEFGDGTIDIRLHGNLIASFLEREGRPPLLSFFSAGWPTKTTVDRINQIAVANLEGVRVGITRGEMVIRHIASNEEEIMREGTSFILPSAF